MKGNAIVNGMLADGVWNAFNGYVQCHSAVFEFRKVKRTIQQNNLILINTCESRRAAYLLIVELAYHTITTLVYFIDLRNYGEQTQI